MKKEYLRHIIVTSLLITIAIFSVAILLNYELDKERVNDLSNTIEYEKFKRDSSLTASDFSDFSGLENCQILRYRVDELRKDITKLGQDLTNYGSKSLFKQDEFDFVKRKHLILELKLYSLINEINTNCGNTITPIIYFFKIDDLISERQGFVLEDLAVAEGRRTAVLSFDIDYTSEPLIKILLQKYNVTFAPTILIGSGNNPLRFTEMTYTAQLNNTLNQLEYSPDQYSYVSNLTYVLSATGNNITKYISDMKYEFENIRNNSSYSGFAKGDILFMLGRLTKNNTMICDSLKYYDNVSGLSDIERAISYETIASIGCGRNKRAFFLASEKIWRESGNTWRADLMHNLAFNNELRLKFSDVNIRSDIINATNAKDFVIGNSYFKITNSDKIITQVDRVNRDWLGEQLTNSPGSNNLLSTFSERNKYPDLELMKAIGWHEGGRIKQLENYTSAKHITSIGTIVVKRNGKWYASNEKGEFMFDVPFDKVDYPTTRFFREDVAMIVDTHGMNMIVDSAIRNNATTAVACCDNIGKIKAAQYLSDHGVKVICLTDKYLPLAMFSSNKILGSPSFTYDSESKSVLIGYRPIKINLSERILAMNTIDYSNVQSYYDTPSRYFDVLNKSITGNSINFESYYLDKDHSVSDFINYANKKKAHVIGVRIFNSKDYNFVREWLLSDKNNRAVLFHSASYPYGYKLLSEFKTQTTFDDIMPKFE